MNDRDKTGRRGLRITSILILPLVGLLLGKLLSMARREAVKGQDTADIQPVRPEHEPSRLEQL